MIIQNAKKITENLGTDKEKITYIQSVHRHNYSSYKLSNGRSVVVDGGKDYFRGSLDDSLPEGTLVENWSITGTEGSAEEVARQKLLWGTYGKNGDEPLHYKLIKDCSLGHLQAILGHFAFGGFPQLGAVAVRTGGKGHRRIRDIDNI